jgi:uncharacterized membrane protein YcaP (DUF421 family)
MDLLAGVHGLIGRDGQHILWWQMTIRALLVFVFGLVLIRLFGRRMFGRQNALDLVIAMLIGSSLSRALTGNAPFLSTLVAMTAIVLVFWLADHLAARWQLFSYLTKGEPLKLTRNGKLDPLSMRRHGIGQGDVEEAARSSGLAGLEDVEQAVLERSGKISTTKRGRSLRT